MILCCGEALIDMVPRQLPGGSEVFLPTCGGALFNTSITLGRLGADCGFFAGLSTDFFGEKLIKELQDSHVDIRHCPRPDLPTTLAFLKLTDGQARYSFVDENTAGRMLDLRHIPKLSPEVNALHFGGISLISEPCGQTYQTLMQNTFKDKVISFDPNIRPGFVKDETAYRARLDAMLAMSDIIKLSDDDIAWLAPGQTEQSYTEQLLGLGAAVVLITCGADGAVARTARLSVSVSSELRTVVDTIGAGDAFNGGFLHSLKSSGLLSKEKLHQITRSELTIALTLAAKIASITVSRAGANPPWLSELV